jgi:hypothetical protein
MNRFPANRPPKVLALALFLSVAVFAAAADGNRQGFEGMAIATTGRIIAIDLENKTFRVRGSDGQGASNLVDLRPKKIVPATIITLPGGLSIHFPGRSAKHPAARRSGNAPNLDEYTVVITGQTLFRDGGDSIRLEDFTPGETISIHGVLSGRTLTASRIAKWS